MADITAGPSVAVSPQDLYRALPISPQPMCIRTLTVYASKGGDDAPIICDLSITDLSQRPQFAALSYVWGRRNPTPETVSCMGCELPVTDSCYLFLLRLRKKLRSNFTIWIDRVCINQQDLVEKAQQLSLMGEVYTRATVVYIWLGEGSNATNRAMDYMRHTGLRTFYLQRGRTDDPGRRHRAFPAFFAAATARW
jgi:hypothetical protein